MSQDGADDDLEWLGGLLEARWSHLAIEELLSDGIHASIDELQSDLNHLDERLHNRYLMTAETDQVAD